MFVVKSDTHRHLALRSG